MLLGQSSCRCTRYSTFFIRASPFRMTYHRRLLFVTLDANAYFPKTTTSHVFLPCTRYTSEHERQNYSQSFCTTQMADFGSKPRNYARGMTKELFHLGEAVLMSIYLPIEMHFTPWRLWSMQCMQKILCNVSYSWKAKRICSKISVFPVWQPNVLKLRAHMDCQQRIGTRFFRDRTVRLLALLRNVESLWYYNTLLPALVASLHPIPKCLDHAVAHVENIYWRRTQRLFSLFARVSIPRQGLNVVLV